MKLPIKFLKGIVLLSTAAADSLKHIVEPRTYKSRTQDLSKFLEKEQNSNFVSRKQNKKRENKRSRKESEQRRIKVGQATDHSLFLASMDTDVLTTNGNSSVEHQHANAKVAAASPAAAAAAAAPLLPPLPVDTKPSLVAN